MKCILELQTAINDMSAMDESNFFSAITPVLCKSLMPAAVFQYRKKSIEDPLEGTFPEGFIPLATQTIEKEASHTDGKISIRRDEKTGYYLLIPFFIHKTVYAVYLVTGKKKELEKRLVDIELVYEYIQKEFHRLRIIKKKSLQSQKSAENYTLMKLQNFLKNKQTARPWYVQKHFPLLSKNMLTTDFTNLYPSRNNSWIAVLCDITAEQQNRYACFVQTDAWFEILTKTGCSLDNLMEVINTTVTGQRGEWYLSTICAKYTKSEGKLEVCGAGTCYAFLYQHDTGKLISLTFDLPLGQAKGKSFRTKIFNIASGDVFLSCTDGLINSNKRNGDPLGINFVSSLILSCQMMSIDSQMQKIEEVLRENCNEGGIYDDRTIQLIKFP